MAKKVFIIVAVMVVIYVLTKLLKVSDVIQKARQYIAGHEGFANKPYWDFKQWSWGYGTRVPDSTASANVIPNKTISRDEANRLMSVHITNDYSILKPLAKRPLSSNQWTALLSFSYNLGVGTAKTMLNRINNNVPNLESLWKSYIYAGGQVNEGLRKRRNDEWNLYKS